MIYNLDYPFIKKPFNLMNFVSNDFQSIIGNQGWTDEYELNRPTGNPSNYRPFGVYGLSTGETVYSNGPRTVRYVAYIDSDTNHSCPYTLSFNGGHEVIFNGTPAPQRRDISGLLYEIKDDYRTCSYGTDYHFSITDDTPGTVSESTRGKVLSVVVPCEFEVGTIQIIRISAPQGSSKYYTYRAYFPDSNANYWIETDTGGTHSRSGGGIICSLYSTNSTYVPVTSLRLYVQRIS